jgi:hypothetical protein
VFVDRQLESETRGEAKAVVRSPSCDGMQCVGEPHLRVGGVEVALGSRARLPPGTRLRSDARLVLACRLVDGRENSDSYPGLRRLGGSGLLFVVDIHGVGRPATR